MESINGIYLFIKRLVNNLNKIISLIFEMKDKCILNTFMIVSLSRLKII